VSWYFWVIFGRPLQVTVRPMLQDRCLFVLSCLPVCNVGVLRPIGWMDQDTTWCGGKPRPRGHCVRWGPISPWKRHFWPMYIVA